MNDRTCVFCCIAPDRLVWESELVVAVRDAFPVTKGHTLVLPRRHVATYFDASTQERRAIWHAVDEIKSRLDRTFSPDGYNVGFNVGEAAGQTIMHLHVHVIPRYRGDSPDPRGGVRGVIPERQNYLTASTAASPPPPPAANDPFAGLDAFVPGEERHLVEPLRSALQRADRAELIAAFVQPKGLALLLDDLEDALLSGARIRVLTGDYLALTHPDALRTLWRLANENQNFEAYVYRCTDERAFHPKTYIFRRGDHGIAWVGSANLSHGALTNHVEWNLRVRSAEDPFTFRQIVERFERMLEEPNVKTLDLPFIERYSAITAVPETAEQEDRQSVGRLAPDAREPEPQPHAIQREALAALQRARTDEFTRGLVVMAPGLGKTYLSAFDFRQIGGRRALFIAHREEILRQARRTWERVHPERTTGLLMGGMRETDVDLLFASIQTLARREILDTFEPDRFDYVVIDEFHHAAALTYRRVLQHFRPRFLLGLTATPDRMDEAPLLELCENNLVYRAGLVEGIARGHLVAFRYFGVRDEIDFTPIPWRSGRFDVEALTNALATKARAKQALDAYRHHTPTTPQRTLAFCCSVRHAEFMAEFFRQHDIPSVAVHSDRSSAPRATSLRRLESGELEVICCVDVFNEGLDIPDITCVLMLRPTQSPVIFLQQLGRGLRPARTIDKPYLTVIDFIGNHRSFLAKPQTLLNLAGRELQPVVALQAIRAGRLQLPPGCRIEIELSALDMLEAFVRRTKSDRLIYEYALLRDTHGRRPRASEVFSTGACLKPARDRYGSWLGFVAAQGDLSAEEERVWRRHQAWFNDVETTKLTKSFKVIVLRSLLDNDALFGEMPVSDLAAAGVSFLRADPLLRGDIEPNEMRGDDDAAYVRLWRKYPLNVWAEGKGTSKRWFELTKTTFRSRLEVLPEDRAVFEALTDELVELRLTEYRTRLRSHPSAAKVIELPFYADLQVACGRAAEGEANPAPTAWIGIEKSRHRLDPKRHFVVRTSGNSMNGGPNPIRDGDLVLLEWLRGATPEDVEGRACLIAGSGAAGEVLAQIKVPRKQGDTWVLESWAPDTQPLPLPPGVDLEPIARFLEVVEEQPDPPS